MKTYGNTPLILSLLTLHLLHRQVGQNDIHDLQLLTLKPENILFYDIENHGYSLNTNPVPIKANDLPEALKLIGRYRKSIQENKTISLSDQKYFTVPIERIVKSSDRILSGRLYK